MATSSGWDASAWEPFLGPMPAAPEPRSLEAEIEALTPYLGQFTDWAHQQTEWQTQYNYDWLLGGGYAALAQEQIKGQQAAAAAQRADMLGYVTDWGPMWNQAYAATNPAYAMQMQQLEQLNRMTGQLGQAPSLGQLGPAPTLSSNLTASLNNLAGLQLSTGPVSNFSGSLDRLAALQLSTGPTTPFTETLDQQILGELKLGGALTAEQQREAQQSARSAYAARGQALGGSAALAEVLNRESMANARLRERQQLAGGREAAGIQRQQLGQQFGQQREASEIARMQMGQQFAAAREQATFGQTMSQEQMTMGREQMNLARYQTDLQRQEAERNFMLGATQLSGAAAAQSPINMALGAQGYGVPGASEVLGFTAPQTSLTSSILSPTLSYGQDLYNTNLNMAASMYNSYQNNLAALQGAQLQSGAYGSSSSGGSSLAGPLIGAAGTIGAAALAVPGVAAGVGSAASAASAAVSAAFCWVAREVFGPEDKRWRTFRVWMALEAPRELKDFYREHGEKLARHLRRLPHFRQALRAMMEPVAV